MTGFSQKRPPRKIASGSGCLEIHETRELFRAGELSIADHVTTVLETIHDVDPSLNAFVSAADERVLRDARSCDDRLRRLGAEAWCDQPLLGIPITVKDLIQTEDLPTTRGSLLGNPRPRRDAPAVARLRAAGALIVGKTSTSEGGWSASTVSRVAPPTRNPWSRGLAAGGSSGGAAAAVSARLCTAALGTDGAGSIRIPASFCGVVGLKPSYARVPYVPACADRLAHLGPIAMSVRDVAAIFEIIAGRHPLDPDSSLAYSADRRERSELRVAWLEFPGTSPEVRRASERVLPVLEGQLHQVARIEVPFADPYPALVDIIAAAEASAVGHEDEELCDQDRLAIVRYGRSVSGTSVMRAEEARLALRMTLRAVMDRFDLLAMATVPIEPFDFDAIAPPWAADPASLRWLSWSPASYPFNLTGQPALSLPVGFTSGGLPVGVQLVGAVGHDHLLLSTAGAIERDLGALPAPPRLVPEGRT